MCYGKWVTHSAIILSLYVLTSTQLSAASKPKTVAEAVRILEAKWVSDSDRDWILRNPQDQVGASLHFTLGLAIRNEFGLWGGNSALMKSCGVNHPDDCSAIIIEQLWRHIRSEADPQIVQKLDSQFELLERVNINIGGLNLITLGELVQILQKQIDQQVPAVSTPQGEESALGVKLVGDPNLKCFTRAEFAKDVNGSISLGLLLGWISWRNGFTIRHNPPEIEFVFHEKCSWEKPPIHF